MADDIKAPGESATPITHPGQEFPTPVMKTTLPYSLPPNAEPELVHTIVAAATEVAPVTGLVVTGEPTIVPLDSNLAANASAPTAPVVEPGQPVVSPVAVNPAAAQ